MYLKVSLLSSISHSLINFFLVFTLNACNTTSANISQSRETPSSNITANTSSNIYSPDSATASSLTNLPVPFDVAGLHIDSGPGILCPDGYPPPGANLVLATEQLTYSTEEIRQMRAYMTNHMRPSGEVPPPTLRWVTGVSLQPILGAEPRNHYCRTDLSLTNTRNMPLQIPSVDVQLTKESQLNTYQYRLIDRCSLVSGDCIYHMGGGSGPCAYSVSILLSIGNTGSVFTGTPTARELNDQSTPVDCGEFTITPSALEMLPISFFLAPGTPSNIIYSIVPELTLDTPSVRQVLPLTQLASTLAFANASQFSCYRLQGTTFVLDRLPILNLSSVRWCM